MSPPAETFFDDLEHRGHEPQLDRVSATIRFEIVGDEQREFRRVRIDHGDLEVSTSDGPSDCVIGATHSVFQDIVSGRTSVMSALLRGDLAVDGDRLLFVLSRRLLLAPSSSRRSGEGGRAS
jgi:putative sterol carrier protein